MANWNDICLCMSRTQNTCGMSCGRAFHLCQVINAQKNLDADHEGRDQEMRNSRRPRFCDHLGFRMSNTHKSERRGFTMKPIDNCVNECLDIIQLRKGSVHVFDGAEGRNLHDETTVWDQVIQISITNTCRFDRCQENFNILKWNT